MVFDRFLWFLAALFAAFGAFMIAAPGVWFDTVPGAAQTGPVNIHFVRDIGIAYLTLGLATALAAALPQVRIVMLGVVTANTILHTALHFLESVFSDHAHAFNPMEAALVYGSAILMLGVLAHAARRPHRPAQTGRTTC